MTQRLGKKFGAGSGRLMFRVPREWERELRRIAENERIASHSDPFEGRKRARQLRGWGTLAGLVRRAIGVLLQAKGCDADCAVQDVMGDGRVKVHPWGPRVLHPHSKAGEGVGATARKRAAEKRKVTVQSYWEQK